MSLLVIEKSPLNPVQFVQDIYPQNPAHHTVHAGQRRHIDSLLYGVEKADYLYRMQIGDNPEFQFHVSWTNGLVMRLQLIDSNKTVFHIWSPTTAVLIPNNTYIVDGIPRTLTTYHFKITPADVAGLVQGIYYLRLKVDYSQRANGIIDTTTYQESEPIHIKAVHPGTILLAATNFKNDYDTIFVQTSAGFSARMEGALHHPQPDSVDTGFVDSRNVHRKMYSYPGEVMSLTLGGKRGIPDWLKRWGNYAMVCDYKALDGQPIVKDQGASKWEMHSAGPTYPLGGMTMPVRYAKPETPTVSIIRIPVVLVKRPATGYPYFVHSVGLSDSLALQPAKTLSTARGYYITNARDEILMQQSVSAGVSKARINGYATWVNDELRYYNGGNWGYDTSDSIVLPYYLEATNNLAISAISVDFDLQATYAGIVWDSNSYTALGNSSINIFNLSNLYTGGGTVRPRIFHDNTLVQFLAGNASLTALTGTGSALLNSFIVSGTNLTTFNFEVLRPAYNNLNWLEMSFNQLASLTNTTVLASGNPSGGFTQLKTVLLHDNHLPVADVNSILADVWESVALTSGITNGTMTTNNQVPAAAPSVGVRNGIAAKNDLISTYSWSVTTD